MKWDIKILVIFFLTILVYGLSYFFSVGKFAFPLHYVDLSIAAISLFFVFKTPLSLYSLLILIFGFSFTYLLFGVYSMDGNNPTIFMTIRNITTLLFAILITIRAIKNTEPSYRGIYLFLGLLVLGQLLFNGLNFTLVNTPFADLIKSIIGLVICLIVFGKHGQGKGIHHGVKLMFVLIAMFTFRNIVWILSASDLL